MGKPTPGFDVGVVDGRRRPPSARTRRATSRSRIEPERPVGLFPGYWRDDEATADGLPTTAGTSPATARARTRTATSGSWAAPTTSSSRPRYRIGPFEVESALVEHPAVAESAVVGKPDPQRDEIVKAFVVLAPGYERLGRARPELQEHVKAVTAPYKYPREIEFVSELPKTISGKIRRSELRERT